MRSHFTSHGRRDRRPHHNSRRIFLERLEDRFLMAGLSDGIWTFTAALAAGHSGAQAYIQPTKFSALTLDRSALTNVLAAAPLKSSASGAMPILALPNPAGDWSRFSVVESPIMEPALAAQFPEIKTYFGQGIEDPAATVRFDVSPSGFHAQVLSPEGAFYIDPYWHLNDSAYISYYKHDLIPREAPVEFSLPPELPIDAYQLINPKSAREPSPLPASLANSGTELRTYRLANAATGEYTAFHGGTVAAGQAAIVTAINRVTGIYEVELAVRLVLVGNNSSLVYTNSGSDPYSNNDADALLDENQANVDNVIGNDNYDIGHVFGTGGGGLAGLGVVGVDGRKAKGETGSPSPVNDAFYVDYVAHEIGHQFGGAHTFNGVDGNCSGGNRSGGTAYEPGSGSTIQAYAGICGSDNLQPNSDPYFHSISFDQIVSYTTTGAGNAAAQITNTGNSVPLVRGGSDYVIPARTPFRLNAAGTDANANDSLTYHWEQRDLGPAQGVSEGDNGSSPLFRSFLPTADSSRTFPRLSDLLNNTTVIGETLPTTNRNLNFRVIARDNRAGGGGVNTDDIQLTVKDTGAPFAVSSPNSNVSWVAGTTNTVTWNVSGTNAAPISAANVNILLSTDGGNTYSIVLAANTPNDGTQGVTVPSVNSTTARIKVEAADNIFFDISNANFTITGSTNSPPSITEIPNQVLDEGSATADLPFTISDAQTAAGSLIVTASSSNTDLVPNANILLEGAGANRIVKVYSARGTSGDVEIFVKVTDAAGVTTQETFLVIVAPILVTSTFEDFDDVTAPNLPLGWTRSSSGVAATNWEISTTSSDTAPNSVFVANPDNISDNLLISPVIAITSSSFRLQFQNYYQTEYSWDGGVLEISIAGGAFTDILVAGGSFLEGGYNDTILPIALSPLAGQPAWTGDTGGFVTTVVELPAAAMGENIQLRWRFCTDEVESSTGWRIDTIASLAPAPPNAPPVVVRFGGDITYVENSALLLIAGGTTAINDTDSANFHTGTLRVRYTSGGTATDRLSIRNTASLITTGNEVRYLGNLVATTAGGVGTTMFVVTFQGAVTPAIASIILRNIVYRSTSENPTPTRTVSLVATDGDSGVSAEVTKVINATAIIDNSAIGNFGGPVIYVENSTPKLLSSTALVTDVDTATFNGGRLVVRLSANASADDRLTILSQNTLPNQIRVVTTEVAYNNVLFGTFTGGVGAIPLVIQFYSNVTTLAVVQALLRNIQFSNVSENPSSAPRTVTAQLIDGNDTASRVVAKTIRVNPVIDKPVIGGVSGTIGYVRNAAALVLASSATVTDLDSPNFATGKLTISVTSGADASNRILLGGTLFTVNGNELLRSGVVIGTLNANAGRGLTKFEVTFNAQALPSYVQQLIRAIRFQTVNSATAMDRVVSFSLTDGDGGTSLTRTKTVDVR